MTPRSSSTRDALLDAAQELLDQGGQAAVTLREVGRRAGVSHNAPYKHFANKEALLAAVAARELRRHGARLAAAIKRAPSPEEALAVALREQVGAAVAHPERARLIYGRWTTATATDELVEAAHAASTLTIETVRAAQERGALPPGDPEHLAAMLRATSRGAAELEAAGHLSPEGKGRSDAAGLIDSLLAYLDPRRAAPS
jgi:AcrR family transcriptional regulator